MSERGRSRRGPEPPSSVLGVIIPVALLFAVIGILAGLVFGGVLQGANERSGPVDSPATPSTIIIEP